jgi:hypothetical protein
MLREQVYGSGYGHCTYDDYSRRHGRVSFLSFIHAWAMVRAELMGRSLVVSFKTNSAYSRWWEGTCTFYCVMARWGRRVPRLASYIHGCYPGAAVLAANSDLS